MILQVIGSVENPWPEDQYPSQRGEGLLILFNNLLKFVIVLAGIFAFINLIVAGYGFMSAGGNPDKVTAAWNKIWQSLVGLIVVAGSFVLAGVIGYLVFGDPRAILTPAIYSPGS